MEFVIFNNGLITESAGFSGSDRRVYEWTKILVRKGYNIKIFVPKIGVTRFSNILDNVNIIVTSAFGDTRKNFYLLTYLWRAFRGCLLGNKLNIRTAIIYSSSDLIADSIPAIYMKLRNKKAKLICGLHLIAPNPLKGFSFQNKINFRMPETRNIYYYISQKIVIFFLKRTANLVLVSNRLNKQYLLKKGFKESQVVVTYGAPNWMDITAAEKKGDIDYDACFLGRNHPQKGLDDLLKSWQIVCGKNRNLRLLMLGELSELKDKVNKMGLKDNIFFYGFVDGKEKYSILKSCKLSIFPSHYESFGMVACEAMACGLPVVAYDLPIYKEIYKEGMLKVPIGDYHSLASCIEQLLNDDSYRNKLSQAAVSSVSAFNWLKTCDIILEQLCKV